jgi:hypothetical protein
MENSVLCTRGGTWACGWDGKDEECTQDFGEETSVWKTEEVGV